MGSFDPAAVQDRIRRLELRLARQTAARQQAEAILEGKSLELYELNRALAQLNETLEQRVKDRTRELDDERRRALHLAQRDMLTGLPNRMMLREHMQGVVDRAPVGDIAILYLDLDGFKAVNDTLGHLAGDELLCTVASRLSDCCSSSDFVARLGGDEFAIVHVGPSQPANAALLCDRILQALQMPFELHGRQIIIGTSIGITLAAPCADSADMLLREADIALYRAKAEGRGTWRLFKPEMDEALQVRRNLELDLRRALVNDELTLFYQPLVEARQGEVVGYEALLRWHHPRRGLVAPNEFIPVAEEIGLIREIGVWVLRRACEDATAWPSKLHVAVNLSPAQFIKGDLLADVGSALTESGLSPNRLELEITESVLLQDSQTTLDILHGLRGLGVRISMDDFGTGYSSLSYLQRFPFDKIKIDRSFVSGGADVKHGLAIVRAVVGLGRSLGMKVLAEGVETADQYHALQLEGCNELQGYLFGRPQPLKGSSEKSTFSVGV